MLLTDNGVPSLATATTPEIVVTVVTAVIVPTVATAGSVVTSAVTTVRFIRAVEEAVDPLAEGEVVAEDGAGLRLGWTSLVKYATRRAIPRKIAGLVTPRRMNMVTRKSTLATVSTQIGIKILVPPITLRVSSTI
jgi:hypothetical protein